MRVLALIYDGFEELEAVAPFALLRRAGIEVVIASLSTSANGAHNINLKDLEEIKKIDYKNFDALLLPGGPHYHFMQQDQLTLEIISYFAKNFKVIAAICAAPTILGKMGLLKGKKYTCFTALNADFGGFYEAKYVVCDGNIITAISAAAAIDFAYAIIEKLAGKEVLNEMLSRIYYAK